MKGAFQIEGLVPESNTVLVEIERSILAPVARLLQSAPIHERNRTGLAVRALGFNLRNAATVLYGESPASDFDFREFDPD